MTFTMKRLFYFPEKCRLMFGWIWTISDVSGVTSDEFGKVRTQTEGPEVLDAGIVFAGGCLVRRLLGIVYVGGEERLGYCQPVQFENLTINSADDIVRAFHDKAGGRFWDAHHSSWMLRFARVSQENRAMFAEAIARLVDDIGGEDLRPTYELGEVMTLAHLMGTSSHMPRLRKRLMEDVSDGVIKKLRSLLAGSVVV